MNNLEQNEGSRVKKIGSIQYSSDEMRVVDKNNVNRGIQTIVAVYRSIKNVLLNRGVEQPKDVGHNKNGESNSRDIVQEIKDEMYR